MTLLSLLPALVTILLTFKTKKLIPSLLAGILVGSFLIRRSLFGGITAIGGFITTAVADKDSIYALGFLVAFGSLADLIEMAGGISGFSARVEKWIKSEKAVFGWAWYLSLFTFFDSSFHTIAVGTVLKPLLEKVNGSKEKFAFLLSVTSLQLILLIPIATSYLGYMVSLVAVNIRGHGFTQSAYTIVAKSVVWNFFSWIMLLLAVGVTLFGLGFGRFKVGKAPAEEEELTQSHVEKEKAGSEAIEEYPRRSRNLLIPIIVLLISTVFFFWWTGRRPGGSFIQALVNANYNEAIFAGIILSIFFAIVYYLLQKISLAEIEAHIIKGGEKVFSLIIILVLSWALNGITEELGFSRLLGESFAQSLPRFLVPAVLFLLAGLISYTIGSSWATWALMMPVAVAFAANTGFAISVMVGTVWAGGAVVDIVSPLSAEMSGLSFGEHLVTSLPYVIIGVVLTFLAYLAVGILA